MDKEFHKFLAREQHELRQRDRFGDIRVAVTTISPSSAVLNSLQELIFRFIEDPTSNINLLLDQSEYLQYLPLDFVQKLKETNYYSILSIMLTNPDFRVQTMRIISNSISQISKFTFEILRNVQIDEIQLFKSIETRIISRKEWENTYLSFINIIGILIEKLPVQYPEFIFSTLECASHILFLNSELLDDVFKDWKIAHSVMKRLDIDIRHPKLYHADIKLLLQIIETRKIKLHNTLFYVTRAVISDFPEEILIDIIVLFAKIIETLPLTKILASGSLIEKLILYLSPESSYNLRSQTINLIHQLSCGNEEPIMLLVQNNLLGLLLNFANEFPNNSDQPMLVASFICKYRPSFVEQVCEAGFVDLLLHHVVNGNINTKRAAVYLAANIMNKGTFKEIAQVAQPGIISTMMEFLEEDSIKIAPILEYITHGIDAEAEAASSSLKEAIDTSDFRDLLHRFIESDDQEVSNNAKLLLQKFEC